MKTKIRS